MKSPPVNQAGLGSSPAFAVPDYELQSLAELPLYTMLGALCGVTAVVFVMWSKASGEWFKSLRRNAESPAEDVLLPAIGGITTGVLALVFPEIMYQGFENVNKLLRLNGEYGVVLLLEIVAVKVFATGISKASGLVGGLYAPAIFLGAALGSAFSDVGHLVVDGMPGLAMSAPQAYALVGVAAMLAAICQVPLTAVLLLFELTQDYAIIAPTLGAVGISYWLSTLLRKAVLSPVTAAPAPAATPTFPAATLGRMALPTPTNGAINNGGATFSVLPGVLTVDTVLQSDAGLVELQEPAGALTGVKLTDCVVLHGGMHVSDALVHLTMDDKVGLVVDGEGGVVGVVTVAMLTAAMSTNVATKKV